MLVLIGHRHTITHIDTKDHVQGREADTPLACVAWRSKQFLKQFGRECAKRLSALKWLKPPSQAGYGIPLVILYNIFEEK